MGGEVVSCCTGMNNPIVNMCFAATDARTAL